MPKTDSAVKTLYLPSTPLNVLVSCALAIQNAKASSKKTMAELWLIDQKNTHRNPYYQALLNWQSSPFQNVLIFSAANNNLNKRLTRQQIFCELEAGLKDFLPQKVAVGSDRRIEFQFVMHSLSSHQMPALGLYLDDGLYSYAGRPFSLIKDGINALLKKLAYGFWWQEPKTIGASHWIDQAWLFSPEQAVRSLKNKERHRLLPEWFMSSEIKSLSFLVAKELDYLTENLSSFDVIILISHPNNVKKMSGYQSRIQFLIRHLSAQGKRVAVKYHPRTEQVDFLNLKDHGALEVIPAQMAFEFCLPLFKKECWVIGDVGTSLFTCKWLRPDLEVMAVLEKSDSFQNQYISLSQAMKIKVMSQIEDILEC